MGSFPPALFFRPEYTTRRRLDKIECMNERLERVLGHLRKYEHPLLVFDARPNGDAVDVLIRFKDLAVPVHTYVFQVHPRDLDHPQFEWTFQRQLYDGMHDYFVEMFTRTPQSKHENEQLKREGKL